MNKNIVFVLCGIFLTGCDPISVLTTPSATDGRPSSSQETNVTNDQCDRVFAYADGSQGPALMTAELCSSGIRIVEFYGKKAGNGFNQSAVVPAADSADFNVVLNTPGFSAGYPDAFGDQPGSGSRVVAVLMSDLNVESRSGRAFFCANKSICKKSDADVLARLEFE